MITPLGGSCLVWLGLTFLSLWMGHLLWLRRVITVCLCLIALLISTFGISQAGRHCVARDVEARFRAEAPSEYKAGIFAAQSTVFALVPNLLVLYGCLGLLAWFPPNGGRRERRGVSSSEKEI